MITSGVCFVPLHSLLSQKVLTSTDAVCGYFTRIHRLVTDQEQGGLAYDDIYEPDEFGSSGGGSLGGRGGGRIWINVTNTLHIDGTISSDGDDATISGGTTGAGGSGGSIWIWTNVSNSAVAS